MTGNRDTRLQIMLDSSELKAIDDWRFEQRMPSRAAAVRQLLRLGMKAAKLPTDPTMRSSDFSVVRKNAGNRKAE